MDAETYKRVEVRLNARRAELLRALSGIEHELDRTPNPDFADRATEREGDEVLEALGHADQTELRAVETALRRLEEGNYGICLSCGDPISQARLETVPTAALCRDCI